jgi:hypothetical protein
MTQVMIDQNNGMTNLRIQHPPVIGLKARAVPTVRIQSEDGQGFIVINKEDYDPAVHTLFEAPKPKGNQQPQDKAGK